MRWILLVVLLAACDATEDPEVTVAPPPRVAFIPAFVPVRHVELDTDGDGIPDAVDQCPDDPEDKDAFEDDDGCPDPDNDTEGILDVEDRCPDEPEDANGFDDNDGCPDVVRDVVE